MATKKKVPTPTVAKKVAPKAVSKKVAPQPVATKKAASTKATPQKKLVAQAPATDKRSSLEKIAVLQAQMSELKTEAAQEIKEQLLAARGTVRGLENELASLTSGSGGRKARK